MNKKPILFVTDDLAEGVYADSGVTTGDCWTVTVTRDQQDAGGYSTFRIKADHSTAVQHISTKTVVTIVFNGTVNSAEYEGFDVKVQGDKVILTRESHANAYLSGDNFNSLLKIWSPTYQTIQSISANIVCTHATNVQGKYD
jgi:hypothetical protein